ncbi:restriction endonuclease subunit S [Pasteurella caecimuris]|nr:restriction endonuclease subunit S [Pasteurella caecimuris]MCR1838388.1 restriction endonuclease subunit S [Pasteurella caecimuris]MCU0107586.1 restriction endonuclease subunit S [Pasteurella caecimuris]
MNDIEKMIESLCPDRVEFFKISDICERNSGINITAAKMKELHKDNAPVRIFAGGSTFADVSFSDLLEKDIIKDVSIIVKSRGYIGFEYYDKPFTHKNEFWSYTTNNKNACLKYLYYYLINHTEFFQKKAKATSVKIPQLSVSDTDNFKIPLPPLEIQQKL